MSRHRMPVLLRAVVVASIGLSACAGNAGRDAERTLTSRDTSTHFVVTPAQGVVMEPHHVSDMLRTCGRSVPTSMTGYWAPDAQTLADLETRLPGMLDGEVPFDERPRMDRIPIIRQYVGLVRLGRRVIYVNGWPDQGLPDSRNWTRSVMVTCGGGRLVFGVLYDPETRTFSHFAGNGPI